MSASKRNECPLDVDMDLEDNYPIISDVLWNPNAVDFPTPLQPQDVTHNSHHNDDNDREVDGKRFWLTVNHIRADLNPCDAQQEVSESEAIVPNANPTVLQVDRNPTHEADGGVAAEPVIARPIVVPKRRRGRPTLDLPPEEKIKRKRSGNKVAAKKSRQLKKALIDAIIQLEPQLEEQNKKLRQELHFLELKVHPMRQWCQSAFAFTSEEYQLIIGSDDPMAAFRAVNAAKLLANEDKECNCRQFYIHFNHLTTSHTSDTISPQNVINLLSKLSFIKQIHLETNSATDETQTPQQRIVFDIEDHFYVKQLINDLKVDNLWQTYGTNTRLCCSSDGESDGPVVVEYSSPNIAKPFHVGNYRSTIIGHFVANFHRFCGHRVIALNYLGDFGTQFGILSLAFDRFGDDQSLAANPLRHLFDVYVKGSTECKASEEWRQSAKDRFNALETKQNADVLNQWNRFRELSVDRLKHLYQRIGIDFDEFHSESMYSSAGHEVIDRLRQLGHLESAGDDSRAEFAVVGTNGPNKVSLKIPVIKSDGSTLYLTRKLTHLKFGRILGMSTRKGDIVFLEDVLNEAKERAIESCKTSPNTKISEENFESVSDILGISGLLIHDLSHRRVQEYRFNWEKAIRHSGETGIALQYTHARLCSLETNCGVDIDYEFEPKVEALSDFEAKLLMNRLSQFDEILIDSFESLEPSLLVRYLFDLRQILLS
ncbi:unnamed protein product [Medioppia subpectinata]|uniref:Probable arginine--tRNA ligase, mitochondrial n=1 Tax=Medioppia subpectinata TaxID=1979941 RepID=A0A7R9KCM2_9ACAR|nr:unnamed protein product [Medioppia subpectinata]CAG2101032.1 unnamed protein product [Medioppia subpectinata]